jgi:hypothetical protein
MQKRSKVKMNYAAAVMGGRWLRLALLAWLAAGALPAAEHHGTVKFNGVPVPGATVTASEGDRKFVAITDPQGAYAFADLADGIWNIRVEMLCFEPIVKEVAISPDAPSPEWDLKMLSLDAIKAAAASTTSAIAASIEKSHPAPQPAVGQTLSSANPVPAATPSLTAAAAKIAAKVKNSKKSKSKPAASSVTADQSANFQRADVTASAGSAAPGNNSAGLSEAVPAAEPGQTSDAFLINGSANNGATSSFAASPAFGNMRKGFGARYSGALNVNLDNSLLDARNYSLTGQDTAKPYYNHLQGNVSVGGPLAIKHFLPYSRTSPNFFVGYQWQRWRNASIFTGLVPDDAQRAGDFSQAVATGGQPLTVYDPSNGLPFPGNIIPQNRISPQAMALMRLYPQPNFAGSSVYNDQIAATGISGYDGVQGRVNKTLGSENNVFAQFAWRRTNSTTPSLFGFTDSTYTSGFQSMVNWLHRFNQRTFLTLNYTLSRGSQLLTPYFAGLTNISGDAGITGNNQQPQNWGPPSLSFTGGSGITQLTDAEQSYTRNQTSSVGGNLYWNHRSHNVTLGGDFRRQQFNYLSQQNPRGSFGFTGAATQTTAGGAPVSGTGIDFADFLLGVPDTSAIAFGNADKYLRDSIYDGYFQDDWRMRAGFTLNLGLRWEYSAPITELYGRLVNLDITPGFASEAPVVAASPTGALTGQRYPDSLLRPDKAGWEPRVGIAWHPILGSSMVIRAGYGITRDTSVYQSIAARMMQQSPLSKSLSVANSAADPLTLADGFNASPNTTMNTFAVDPNFRIGYAQNWQLSAQRDLPGGLVMTATYLGTKGTREQQQFLPNTYPAGAADPCPACLPGYYYLTSNGNSTREAGTFQLRRRLHNGLTASASYTFARAIDDASLGGRGQGSTVVAQNWLDLSAERALSNTDQRHVLSTTLQYTSGMGMHGGTLLSGWRGDLFKHWTISTTINAGTGMPLTPIYGSEIVPDTGVSAAIRPSYTGASVYTAPAGRFLNAKALTAPLPGEWGNAGRNSITGPATFALNASLQRSFADGKLDLRLDTTNALNHVVFASWLANVSSPQFGAPISPNAMRVVEINLRWRFF